VLHEQLEAECEVHIEARRIIAGLVQRIPELEAPTESPKPRPSEARPGPSEATAEAQEGTERSW
jgi:BMFP domain-containing protein YqiC